MSPFSFLLVSISILSFFQSFANAFSFTYGTSTQCDPLTINWTGGTAPFQLLLVPVYGTPRNISIPPTAFSNGKGSFSFPLELAQGAQMLLTMSDATGWNSGGSTPVLNVGASQGGSCNTADPGVAFIFQLNTALQQCRPFVFSGYTTAIQPVTIYATIPGGNSIALNPPVGSTSFSWTANVASGTSMIFFMTDAQGRQGGSSDVRPVSSSDDNTCLSGQSPLSTTGAASSAPSLTGTNSPSKTTSSRTSPSSSAAPAGGISIAALAGTVIGGLLFLAVVVTLGLFCLRKKRNAAPSTTAPPWVGPGSNFQRGQQSGIDSNIDLTYNPAQAPVVTPFGVPPGDTSGPVYPYSPSHTGQRYDSNPFLDSPSHTQYSPSNRYSNPTTQYSDHPGQYPAAGAHYRPPSQYPYDPYQQDAFVEQPPQFYPPLQHQPPGVPPVDPDLPGAEFAMHNAEQSTSRGSMSTAQRKASVAGKNYKPSRFIVHTDAEDVLPPPNVDGVVELPPQYSERHGGSQIQDSKQDPNPGPPRPPYP